MYMPITNIYHLHTLYIYSKQHFITSNFYYSIHSVQIWHKFNLKLIVFYFVNDLQKLIKKPFPSNWDTINLLLGWLLSRNWKTISNSIRTDFYTFKLQLSNLNPWKARFRQRVGHIILLIGIRWLLWQVTFLIYTDEKWLYNFVQLVKMLDINERNE